ncbi:MAG: hypothetical protein ACE5GW_07655 [Planctomycetota bacterium]
MSYQQVFPYVALSLSTVVLVAIIFAVTQRRRRRIHIPMMVACFVADFILLLAVELSREAVKEALTSESWMVRIHVIISVPMLLSWFFALYTGYQRRVGRRVKAHFVNAWVFLVLRALNWVTALFVYEIT